MLIYICMKEQENNTESPERQIANKVSSLHDEFLKLVPNYARGVWNPKDAIKSKSGSCMAELLYVVGGLLADDIIADKDAFIGFSKSHGADVPIGFVGNQSKKHSHTTLFITVKDGLTLGMDFRANRADEVPRIQVMREDDLSFEDSYYVGGLEEALHNYASLLGEENIQIDGLMAMHREPSNNNVTDMVRFDDDF